MNLYQVYKTPTLIINSLGMNANDESTSIVFNVTVANIFNSKEHVITYNLTSWNTGVKIKVSRNLDETANNSFIKLSEYGETSIDFSPNLLFNGSIINFNINCEDCIYYIN